VSETLRGQIIGLDDQDWLSWKAYVGPWLVAG
jgi:hypothetical protein